MANGIANGVFSKTPLIHIRNGVFGNDIEVLDRLDISLVLDLWMEKSRNIEFQQMTLAIGPSATGNLIHGQVMGTSRWAKRHSFGKKY